ncbi:MAG: phosphohydrolase, partial [Halohasta sp.]
VARQVEGGGHPKAAGCKPDIYDDMMDYASHWLSEGETAKRVILAAFERVAEELAAEEVAAGEGTDETDAASDDQ